MKEQDDTARNSTIPRSIDSQQRTRCLADLRQGREGILVVNVYVRRRSIRLVSPGTTAATTPTFTTTPTPTPSATRPIEVCIDFDVYLLFLFSACLGCGFGLEILFVTGAITGPGTYIPCQRSKLHRPHSFCVRRRHPKLPRHLHWLHECPPV
jgi:hypothetical protein